MQVRDGGVWKNGTPHALDGGVWKPAQEVWVKDAGVWKKEWQNARVLLEFTYAVAADGADMVLLGTPPSGLVPYSFPAEGTGLYLTLFRVAPNNGMPSTQLGFMGGAALADPGDYPSLTPWLNTNFKGIEIEGQMYLKSHDFTYDAKMWWHSGGAGLPVNALSRHAGKTITLRIIGT